MEGVAPQFLTGEREILEGNLAQCQAAPDNIPVRVLLVETMGSVARLRPEAAAAMQGPFVQLQQQHPIAALDNLFAGQPQQA